MSSRPPVFLCRIKPLKWPFLKEIKAWVFFQFPEKVEGWSIF